MVQHPALWLWNAAFRTWESTLGNSYDSLVHELHCWIVVLFAFKTKSVPDVWPEFDFGVYVGFYSICASLVQLPTFVWPLNSALLPQL